MNILEQAKRIPHGLSVITEWVGSGGVVADPDVSQRRADTCTGRTSGNRCQENDMGFSITAPVANVVKQYLAVKNGIGLRVLGERDLGICRICSCNLRLLIYEPKEKVDAEMTDDEIASLPSHCWKLWS